MARPAHIALLVAVPALAVAGCGGGDSASETSAARGASGQQGTTRPQAGATGTTGARGARPKRTGKPKQGSGKKSGAGRSNTGPAAPAESTPPNKQANVRPLSPKELKQALAKHARFLCKTLTLEGLAPGYGIKSGDPDEVAQAYAAGYLVGQRDAVVAGCKAGLLESK